MYSWIGTRHLSCHLVSLFSIPFWLCVSNVFVKPSKKYHLDGWIGFPAYFIHLLSQDTDLYSWREASLPPAHWQHHHIAWFGWSERFFNWIILFFLLFLMGAHKNVCWQIFRAGDLDFLANKQLFCPQVGIFAYYSLLSDILVELNLDRIQPALLSHSAGYWWPAHHTWWWYSPVATCLMDLLTRTSHYNCTSTHLITIWWFWSCDHLMIPLSGILITGSPHLMMIPLNCSLFDGSSDEDLRDVALSTI